MKIHLNEQLIKIENYNEFLELEVNLLKQMFNQFKIHQCSYNQKCPEYNEWYRNLKKDVKDGSIIYLLINNNHLKFWLNIVYSSIYNNLYIRFASISEYQQKNVRIFKLFLYSLKKAIQESEYTIIRCSANTENHESIKLFNFLNFQKVKKDYVNNTILFENTKKDFLNNKLIKRL